MKLAEHCSEREQLATEAERETVDLKRLRFFSEQLASGQPREFEAVVSEVRNFGVFVYLPKVDAYGLIHVSQLANDFFDFDPVKKRLRGRREGVVFSLGCELSVIIAKVDGDRRMLDFAPVPGSLRSPRGVGDDGLGAPPPPSPKGKGKGGKRPGPGGDARGQGGGAPPKGRGSGRRPGGPAVPAPARRGGKKRGR